MNAEELKKIIEATLMAADEPIATDRFLMLFGIDDHQLQKNDIEDAIIQLTHDCEERGYELIKVSSGYRYQVRSEMAHWVSRLWLEKPKKNSRAFLETLAIIAYRQPVTRGDIEDIRGVSVSSNIIKSLFEREWIRSVGHRDVPGKPALFATTKQFLDYFNLEKLSDLPPLGDLKDINALAPELAFEDEEPNPETEKATNYSDDNLNDEPNDNGKY